MSRSQPLEQQQQVVREVFNMVSKRSDHVCNFVEGDATLWGPDTKIVYRYYATLYIAFVVDGSESELGILDLVQVFVEALDKSFQNVCELHLIFHSDQVSTVLPSLHPLCLVLIHLLSMFLPGTLYFG